jgi:uncharacterized damage-inducible protein DinB
VTDDDDEREELVAMTLDDFRILYAKEHATTRKVLQAYPPAKYELKAHDRSNSAHALGWTFVIEEQLMLKALRNQPILGGGFPPAPATWQEVLDAFDAGHAEMNAVLAAVGDADLKPATFFVAPKTTGEFAPVDFLWFLLSDQIHHRGQLSVYLRLAGAKVPSIYGPSADEPWF